MRIILNTHSDLWSSQDKATHAIFAFLPACLQAAEAISASPAPAPSPCPSDGVFGPRTVAALQQYLRRSMEGAAVPTPTEARFVPGAWLGCFPHTHAFPYGPPSYNVRLTLEEAPGVLLDSEPSVN